MCFQPCVSSWEAVPANKGLGPMDLQGHWHLLVSQSLGLHGDPDPRTSRREKCLLSRRILGQDTEGRFLGHAASSPLGARAHSASRSLGSSSGTGPPNPPLPPSPTARALALSLVPSSWAAASPRAPTLAPAVHPPQTSRGALCQRHRSESHCPFFPLSLVVEQRLWVNAPTDPQHAGPPTGKGLSAT